MEDVRDLKELQIDALREVANIGAGHAAPPCPQLTNRRIMISVPQSTSCVWRKCRTCWGTRRTWSPPC